MISREKELQKKYTDAIDNSLQAVVGRFTNGISPAAVTLAFIDWYCHLIFHPAKEIALINLLEQNYWYFVRQYFGHVLGDATGEFCMISTPQDKRFIDKSWQRFPYSFIYESFLLIQNWWHVAATDVRGVSKHHQEVVDFVMRQFLDMLSPSNFVFTNPEIQQVAINERGENFIRGFENFIDDVHRYQYEVPPAGAEQFEIGKNIAVSRGKVIYRNDLIELIQYAPATKKVYAEPILITPAWIMKYYILDLTSKHSFVQYLVKNGHTVFMISWKNPQKRDHNFNMEDYLNLGIMSALDVISAVQPKQKIHLVGYCLGGTLAAIATAAMARDDDNRLRTLTLLAAQVDFKEPGELGLFIDESQINFLESLMKQNGYLDTHQMLGTFQLLRSNDLIWSRIIHEYLIGVRKPLTDLMAWNADATRLPYKMHSEYLRRLFLHNQLAIGKYLVNGKPIALPDITVPMFVVATERDHVSPWHSVFQINLLTTGNVTFTLTSGGHNVGIVSLPSKKTKRHYRISTLKKEDRYIDANRWHKSTKPTGGSWWPAFEAWITAHSSKQVNPPPMGNKEQGYAPIVDAPGTYVLEK